MRSGKGFLALPSFFKYNIWPMCNFLLFGFGRAQLLSRQADQKMWTGYYPLEDVKHDTSRLFSTNRYFLKLIYTAVRPSRKFIICFTAQPMDMYIHYVMSEEAYKHVYKWDDLAQNWCNVTLGPMQVKHIIWSKADYPQGSDRGGQMT